MADQLGFLKYALEERLPYILGPAKTYSVHFLKTNLADLVRGRINHLLIQAEEIKFKGAPAIKDLKIHLYSIDFDVKKIKEVKEANFIITITEEEINRYLSEEVKIKYPLAVAFAPRGVILNTFKQIKGVRVSISLEGYLEVYNGRQINFADQSMKVAFIPIPYWLRKKILKDVNPLVDLKKLDVVESIRSIEIQQGKVVASGKARIRCPVYFKQQTD